jgi:hypothetical protein
VPRRCHIQESQKLYEYCIKQESRIRIIYRALVKYIVLISRLLLIVKRKQ